MGFEDFTSPKPGLAPAVSGLSYAALQELNNQDFSSNMPGVFKKGIIVDVIFDPANLGEAEIFSILKQCTVSRSVVESMPRNSCVVRMIDDGLDHMLVNSAVICFPMFPPHLTLPIKPGETVFIIDLAPEKLTDVMYWVCRVPSPDYVCDINFTHNDRTMMESAKKMTKAPSKPEFVNGMGEISTNTLRESKLERKDKINAYDKIWTGSIASRHVTYEAVPRFVSRPGDFVLQGSNNTLICLGEDRGWNHVWRPTSAPADPTNPTANKSNANFVLPMEPLRSEELPKNADELRTINEERMGRGTVDIVTGRGQVEGTKPDELKNSRNVMETNKNPVNYEKNAPVNFLWNPAEGDPDFMTDLSRVYVSMKTSGDANLNLVYNEKIVGEGNTGGKPIRELVEDAPYVIMKSNEVRIVARNDGSIRIIKEAEGEEPKAGTNDCVITLQKDGVITIDASKVRIGDGRENQVFIADPKEDADEPLVLGQTLFDMLEEFCDTLATNKVVALGVDNPPVTTAAKALKAKLNNFKSKKGFVK